MNSLRLATLALGLLTLSCGASPPGSGSVAQPGAPVDLTLRSLAGETLSLSALRGKVVVVDAWATWCGPCLKALPSLEKLARLMPDDIVVVGLSVDHDQKALADFLAKRPLPYFVAHADAAASRAFRSHALPTLFFLDREGVIRETLVGTHPDVVLIDTAKSYL